jgi:uncharacterized repeat protein (TIGR03899 family)
VRKGATILSKNEVSLINLRSSGKAVAKLVAVVSGAIGRIYGPLDKIVNAYADAKIERIRSIAATTTPIAVRAAERIAHIEERRQLNIERIIAAAIPELPNKVSPKSVDPDWIAAFFDQCKDVSTEHMQQIWARMLAGEVANPGTFSRRTLLIVQSMTKSEAESFTQFCSLTFEFDKLIYGFAIPAHGIFELIRSVTSTREELHLQNIGLLSSTNIWLGTGSKSDISIGYFGQRYKLSIPVARKNQRETSVEDFDVQYTPLTSAGNELFAIAGAEPRKDLIDLWQRDFGPPGHRVLKKSARATKPRAK